MPLGFIHQVKKEREVVEQCTAFAFAFACVMRLGCPTATHCVSDWGSLFKVKSKSGLCPKQPTN